MCLSHIPTDRWLIRTIAGPLRLSSIPAQRQRSGALSRFWPGCKAEGASARCGSEALTPQFALENEPSCRHLAIIDVDQDHLIRIDHCLGLRERNEIGRVHGCADTKGRANKRSGSGIIGRHASSKTDCAVFRRTAWFQSEFCAVGIDPRRCRLRSGAAWSDPLCTRWICGPPAGQRGDRYGRELASSWIAGRPDYSFGHAGADIHIEKVRICCCG